MTRGGGASIAVNTMVTYTVTFNEDMDASTVTAADFGNAGTSDLTIGTVSETITPGVFTVQATPTTAGTLQLRVTGWSTAVDDADIDITVTDNFYGSNPGVDKVEVKIKKSLATNNKLFSRLKVVTTP